MSAQVSIQSQAGGGAASRGTGRKGPQSRGGGRRGQRRGGAAGQGDKTMSAVAPDPKSQADTDEPGDLANQVKPVSATNMVEREPSSDTDVCWICAEPVKYYSVSECNHRTCHVCAIRLRALYKKKDCTFCKEPQNVVIFTTSQDAPFSSFTPESIPHKDPKLSVYFETREMMEDSLVLLRFNCADDECDYIGNGWGDLRLHARATHGKLMCDLCIRHKKVFAHELVLYPQNVLPMHLPSMHLRQRMVPQEQIEGGIHPLCQFCRECFFGDDELYAHMREKHEECFICKRNEFRDQYFQNYESLERHFNTIHHPCNQPDCLARKFVVFNTALDLKGHMVEEHGGDMSAKDRKDARRVQADFTFEEVGRPGRRDRDRDRDRERDREPPPHNPPRLRSPPPSLAPPLQQTAGSGSRRREAFGGALTTDVASASSNNQNKNSSRPASPPVTDSDPVVAEQVAVSPVVSLLLCSERSTRRHANFLTRLQLLTPNPGTAIPAVKAATRGYRSSESTARDLILTIWNVLDRNLEQTAGIVNAFVDLLDEEEKKQDLLSSWKGFAVEQRQQFPGLVPTSVGEGYAGITSGRVLNAKHSTTARSSQQSSRQVLDRVALAASSSGPPPPPPPHISKPLFPALAPSAASSAAAAPNTSSRQSQRNTPWASSSGSFNAFRPSATAASNTSSFPTIRPVSVPSSRTTTPKQKPPKINNALFPELPSSSAARSKPQVSGNVSLKNILGTTGAPAVSAWQPGGAETGAVVAETPTTVDSNPGTKSAEASGGAGGKGKKAKGKQKQTLFTIGSFPT